MKKLSKTSSIIGIYAYFYLAIDMLAGFAIQMIGFRMIGTSGMGQIAFPLVASIYIQTVSEFGSNTISASKIQNTSIKEKSSLIGLISFYRLFFGIIAIAIYISTALILNRNINDLKIDLIIILQVPLVALMPSWFYIGSQKSHVNNICNAAGKTTALMLLSIMMLTNNNSIFIYCLSFATASLFSLLISIIFIRKTGLNYYLRMGGVSELRDYVKSNFSTFASAGLFNINRYSYMLFASKIFNPTEVGIILACDKFVGALANLRFPFLQILIPKFSRLKSINNIKVVQKAILTSTIVGSAMLLLVYVFSIELSKILLGRTLSQEIYLLSNILPISIISVISVYAYSIIVSVALPLSRQSKSALMIQVAYCIILLTSSKFVLDKFGVYSIYPLIIVLDVTLLTLAYYIYSKENK